MLTFPDPDATNERDDEAAFSARMNDLGAEIARLEKSDGYLDRASWVLRHIQTVQSRLSEQEATANRQYQRLELERQKIALWLERDTARDRRELEVLTIEAEAIAAERLAAGLKHGENKQLSTAYGVIGAKTAVPTIEKDPVALDAWALDHGYVREIPASTVTDWARIVKEREIVDDRFVIEGAVVDGVTVTQPERPDKLTVTAWAS